MKATRRTFVPSLWTGHNEYMDLPFFVLDTDLNKENEYKVLYIFCLNMTI